jgi:hypothetical protein
MDTLDIKKAVPQPAWEEESGLLDFLSKVHGEVVRFDSALGFGIEYMAAPPSSIDSSTEELGIVGFVLVRRNGIMPGRSYCLYSLLKERVLHGFIGAVNDNGDIETLKPLAPLKDFRGGSAALYDWLRDLVKASCDKL